MKLRTISLALLVMGVVACAQDQDEIASGPERTDPATQGSAPAAQPSAADATASHPVQADPTLAGQHESDSGYASNDMSRNPTDGTLDPRQQSGADRSDAMDSARVSQSEALADCANLDTQARLDCENRVRDGFRMAEESEDDERPH